MNSSQGILDKINGDNSVVVDKIIAEAKSKANKIIAKAKKINDEELANCESSLAQVSADIIARRETVAKLDAKKIVMQAKRHAIDEIFAKAKQSILEMSDKEYLSIIEQMIVLNAENGDKVIPSKIDAKRVNAKFIKGVANKHNLNIELSSIVGEFLGGVVLEGVNFDKNISLDAEIESLRADYEAEYANRIFEE